MRQFRNLASMVAVLTLIGAAGGVVATAQAAKPPLCTAGRYALPSGSPLGAGGDVIVLNPDRTIAIGDVCDARRAKLRRTRAGTRLKVKFPPGGCAGIAGRVRLTALLTDGCATLTGAIRLPGADPVEVGGDTSECGDDVVDADADEECDGATGCAAGEFCDDICLCRPLLARASKSGTIALTDDGAYVAMVNPEDNSISVFQTSDDTRLSRVTTGDEPWSLVLAADGATAFVANRAAATVVRVSGIDTATPTVSAPVDVGAEPTGLALTPTGARLFVVEFAEGRVSVIDTATMTVTGAITGLTNPRAIAVTNDGDADDTDELVIVPEFFGEPTAGGEGKDTGRTGRVRIYAAADLAPGTPITFDPIDSGFPAGGIITNPSVMTAPNQLWAVALRGDRIYIPSVSASPEGPPRFDNNVFAVVWVGDLTDRSEVRTGAGSTNLTRAVVDSFTAPPARFVLGDIVDMDFIVGTSVSYVVSRGADAVQRVTWDDQAGVTLGSVATRQIDVIGNGAIGRCQAPTGIALSANATRAYLNCWASRRLGVIDLAAQSLLTTVVSSDAPTDEAGQSVTRGRRFYFTGRGRWSNAGGAGAGGLGAAGNETVGGEGWSSCGSCHPDGLTDNITWIFPAGPRQTTSQDGSFSHDGGAQQQRIFNHSGIFDEHHDFEANTRGVSGGLGAITTTMMPADCGTLTLEQQATLPTNLGKAAKEVADDAALAACLNPDWDDIDNFVRTIRPPGRIRTAATSSVANGRALFDTGECAKCHAGPGWTLSRRFFTPSEANNTTLQATDFTRPVGWPATWSYADGGSARKQISTQPAISADATGPAEGAAVAPLQVACVLRNVGTFGIPGDTPATDALELKSTGARAQGRGGYNIPSLYGLSVGAPYLHHGQAPTLGELLTSAAYDFHTNAGNANFSLTLAANPSNVTDLVTYLRAIDADEATVVAPAGFDGCP